MKPVTRADCFCIACWVVTGSVALAIVMSWVLLKFFPLGG